MYRSYAQKVLEMLLKEIKAIFHRELHELYPNEEIDSFFFLFMEHYLGLEKFSLVLKPNYVVTKEEEQPFFEGLTRLKKEEPVQYILHEAHFMDLTLKVNEHVLIPRPESEELVQWILEEKNNRDSVIRILDVGTGSGCIAIALARTLPNAQVFALDISEDALRVAKDNAKRNNVDVTFFQDDIFNLNLDAEIQFDIIVSNPPYVREMEKSQIKTNVKGYEPEIALFVPDEDALQYYEAIVDFSKDSLCDKGRLFLEINQYLAKETQQLLVDSDFNEVELRKDIFGNFRMLKGIWSGSKEQSQTVIIN